MSEGLGWVVGARTVPTFVAYLVEEVSKVLNGVPSANFTALGLANMP